MTNSDLKERAARLIELEERAEDAKLDVKAAYDAAESAGYTKVALKKAIKLHRMDSDKRKKHESEQLDLETYLSTLEGLNRTRLQEISDRGDKVVARFAAALDREAAE